jgi:general secretion pathway protein C
MISRIAAFVIWAAVAASIVFWILRLGAQPIAAPAHATLVSTASGFRGDLSRVFGPDVQPPTAAMAAVPQMQADARFRLIGVVAPRAAAANAEGLALIATDGKPARAYRVGTPVDGDLVLLTVHSRGASLGPAGQAAQVSLELPALPPPTTGTMPGSTMAAPAPRARMPIPLPPPPPQAVPQPVEPAPPDVNEPERQPEPGDRPMYMPPTSAGRPPT